MTTTYKAQADGVPIIDKSPNEVLDYSQDWAAVAPNGPWLGAGETISSATVIVDPGLTLNSTVLSPTGVATVVSNWLQGGTIGNTYLVTVRVVTSAGRTGERSFRVRVVLR